MKNINSLDDFVRASVLATAQNSLYCEKLRVPPAKFCDYFGIDEQKCLRIEAENYEREHEDYFRQELCHHEDAIGKLTAKQKSTLKAWCNEHSPSAPVHGEVFWAAVNWEILQDPSNSEYAEEYAKTGVSDVDIDPRGHKSEFRKLIKNIKK